MEGLRSFRRHGAKRSLDIYENLGTNNLWQRMFKNTMATTVAGRSKSREMRHQDLQLSCSQYLSHPIRGECHR